MSGTLQFRYVILLRNLQRLVFKAKNHRHNISQMETNMHITTKGMASNM
jgi:hypothetical protein